MPAASPSAPGVSLGEREFVALMAMIMALQALCIDAMLPALGIMAQDLGVRDPNDRQLVVGVYLIAAGIGALFPGALADRFGRRPVLFISLAAYVALTVACALVTDFTALLVLRALQAITSAGLSVLPTAIIRDRFSGDRMARAQSTVAVIFMIVPMAAPSFGQAVLAVASWRWIFGGMALLGVAVWIWAWIRLPETLDPANRQSIAPRVIAANMWEAATNRAAMGYVFGASLLVAGLFGYINSAQQLVAEHFGAGDTFPLLFAAMAGGMALANFTNSRIVERFGARRVSHTALLVFIAVSAVQVWLAHLPHQTLWQFVPVMALNMCLVGFMGANFGSIALQPFARIAGAASSFQMFTRMVIAASLGALIGQAYDGTARPLAWSLLAGGILALGLVLYSEQGRLFRRLTPPGAVRPVSGPDVR
ncbi:multidrug effflux MFS transporter [Novosphingobium sp.]|uniref:multidrug effflux MFS transporter n=1 Tax=Novosphingobium sp. TaxID=1874826 RepID=UPI0022C3D9AA|nr:multidrug effflux MFS transporter [Novosphingobium sp.]MCZ8018161.1 multidrug effflux MFS transporter [Novosphingobium sp.]MCZ8033155.1 multidrug effflux MFS transporter [Novosphingobium sp.]MCZ8051610.1 multidrug effflux MFS transporter [Novosphingobium sp.]MCZ8060152.1 multidrug effflux MFS transporter [Novosphingobium sp.]MCZ8231794.1 multidrug effflux MFS transporter [Novosphingobium sp.]